MKENIRKEGGEGRGEREKKRFYLQGKKLG